MKERDLHVLLEKADELKAVDFLEEVIKFVREIKPMLDSMNSSIAENVLKMPTASKKLAQVTEATEMATTEIMNTIDSIIDKTAKIGSNLNSISESDTNKTAVADSKSLLDNINDDANSIMMALQVQDITSQQIAAVNKVLDTVRNKLASIMNNFEMSSLKNLMHEYREEKGIQTSTLHREIAFDPNAMDAITNKADRQSDVDDLINRISAGEEIDVTSDTVDNNDIDALLAELSSGDSDNAVTAFSENELNAEKEEFSQEEIDAMFGNL